MAPFSLSVYRGLVPAFGLICTSGFQFRLSGPFQGPLGWRFRYEDGTGREVDPGEDNAVFGDLKAVLPPGTMPQEVYDDE